MSSRPRTLKGTRHIVHSRLAVVSALVILALFLTSVSAGSSAGNGSQTSTSEASSTTSSVTTTTDANTTTSGTATTTSAASTTSATTGSNSTSAVQGLIYRADNGTLDSLVNSTAASFVKSAGAVPYYVVEEGGGVTGLVYLTTDVAPSSSWGYHGPVGILAYIDTTGIIKALWLWYSDEPRANMVTPQYLASYAGHSVFDNLTVGSDVLGITGATFTSQAIAGGVRVGGRIVVEDYAANPLPTVTTTTGTTSTDQGNTTNSTSSSTPGSSTASTTNVTTKTTTAVHGGSAPTLGLLDSGQFRTTGLIIALFAAAAVAFEFNSSKLRYGVLGAALVLLGFYAGTMVSITDSVLFISRDFPPFSEYFWYVLYAAVLVTTLIWGRLYCGSVCPFGAFTQLLHKVSPLRLVMPKKVHKRLVYLKYVVLALVLLAVAEGALWATGIEPFLTFFFFEGTAWMWAVVGVTVVLSVPFERFYCSYICPAGAALAIAARLRIREINRWPECNTCRVCERGCPSGAISGASISALECMDCRTCEVNYLSPDICPHYALQRAGNHETTAVGSGMPIRAALVSSGENRAPS